MLLRSSSTPLLNSWLPHSKDSSPEPEVVHQIRRTRSISLSASSSLPRIKVDEEKEMGLCYARTASLDAGLGCFSSSGLEESCGVGTRDSRLVTLNGGGVGGGGRRICGGAGGGGGSDSEDDDSSEFWDSNHGSDSTDVYYQKMIEANPGNSLLLSNYAKFLKDVSFIIH